jgi:CRISPR-associated exonuclease Cas4
VNPAVPELDEDDWVPLSALQHYVYCPRQCALIHLDQVFDDNVHTARGHAVHEIVDHRESEAGYDGVRIERALPLYSRKCGLTGRADVVEVHADGALIPVEYKHGRKKAHRADDVQLCAQALCLEEMRGIAIDHGIIWHHSSRRRRRVELDHALRELTVSTIAAVRQMLIERRLPAPVADARCKQCSLIDRCQPHAPSRGERWLRLRAELFGP